MRIISNLHLQVWIFVQLVNGLFEFVNFLFQSLDQILCFSLYSVSPKK